MMHRFERMIRGVVTRAIVNGGSRLLRVLWMDDRISDDVEYMQPQGVHFLPPTDADGMLLSPAGNKSASVLVCAQGSVPPASIAAGEGGLHYLGAYKVFLDADGSLSLGAQVAADGVGVDALIEARFNELKTAVAASYAALTPLPGAPVPAATLLDNTLIASNPLWPSPTGSATVKVTQ